MLDQFNINDRIIYHVVLAVSFLLIFACQSHRWIILSWDSYPDDGEYSFCILSGDKLIGTTELSMDTYNLFLDDFSAMLPERSVQDPFVNRRWAVEFLESDVP